MPELAWQLQNLISTKKYNFSHISAILKQFQQQSNTMTLQKISIIIVFLSRYFHLTTQNWKQELQKLKYQICYASLMRNQPQKIRNVGQYKKKAKKINHQQTRPISELSINDIMNKVQQKNRFDLQMSNNLITPKKEPIHEQNKQVITVPPFHPDIMASIDEQISHFIKSQSKDSNLSGKDVQWKPDLLAYQNVLAFTQKGINLTMQKKRMSRTKKKAEQKALAITDQKIYLTQGDDRIKQLELLTTKVKVSKQKNFEDGHYFTNQLNKISSRLKNTNVFVQQIKIKKSQLPSFKNQEIFSPMFSFPLNFLSDSNQGLHQEEKVLFVNNDDNPSLARQLQEVIQLKIDGQLFTKKQLSLREFSKHYGISKQIKGQLFYQLMQMNYNLTQKSPQTFGDIIIQKVQF